MQSDPRVNGAYEMHGSTVSRPSRQETKTVRHFEDGKGSQHAVFYFCVNRKLGKSFEFVSPSHPLSNSHIHQQSNQANQYTFMQIEVESTAVL